MAVFRPIAFGSRKFVNARRHISTYPLDAGLVLCPEPAEAINTPKGLESFFY